MNWRQNSAVEILGEREVWTLHLCLRFWEAERRCRCSCPSWRPQACQHHCTTSCWHCGRSWMPGWHVAPVWLSQYRQTCLQDKFVSRLFGMRSVRLYVYGLYSKLSDYGLGQPAGWWFLKFFSQLSLLWSGVQCLFRLRPTHANYLHSKLTV